MRTKFCNKRTTFDKVIVKILKNTHGPKFAHPRTADASPYFKKSMTCTNITAVRIYMTTSTLGITLATRDALH